MRVLKPINTLSFEDMTFTHETGEAIFENITFKMPTAKMVWVRSPGGRGKSTLLKIMAGLLTPQKGVYKINDEIVNEKSFEDFLEFRIGMGYGFDMGGLLNNKTLIENLLLPLEYHKLLRPEQASARVYEMLDLFGLHSQANLRPYAISGSHRKLTCILRAFVNWPQVVFLDDPVIGLKQDNLNDLIHYVEESFSSRGLRQIFFTSESPMLAQHFKAEELLISYDWFTSRAAG